MESAKSVSSNTASEKGKQPAFTPANLATRISRVPSGYRKADHPQPAYLPIIEELMSQIEELVTDYSHAGNGNVLVGASK